MLGKFPLIPKQAFLYFPSKQEIFQSTIQYQQRIIFDGGLQFTMQQNQKIRYLIEKIKKQDKRITLLNFHTSVLLRFLQAQNFHIDNTIKALKHYKKWKNSIQPLQLTKKIEKILKSGILYMCGRDSCYRPIFIINVGKILAMKIEQKLMLDVLGYFFEYMIQNVLIEGQIQTWISIIDLGNQSAFSLGGALIDTIKFLSNNFRCRLHKNYIVRCPSSIKWIWSMIQKILNKNQLQKIILTDEQKITKIIEKNINLEQIEKKYGGKMENIIEYWEPKLNRNRIEIVREGEGEEEEEKENKLICYQQYIQMYQQRKLLERKICQEIIQTKLNQEKLIDKDINLNKRQSLNHQQYINQQKKINNQKKRNSRKIKILIQDKPPKIAILPQIIYFNFN